MRSLRLVRETKPFDIAVFTFLGYLTCMRFIGSVIEKLQRHPKRVVFPEGTEPRVLQAARQFYSLRLGVPILLGDRSKVKETAEALNISLEGIRIINPAESPDLETFAHRFEMLRRTRGLKALEAREA